MTVREKRERAREVLRQMRRITEAAEERGYVSAADLRRFDQLKKMGHALALSIRPPADFPVHWARVNAVREKSRRGE